MNKDIKDILVAFFSEHNESTLILAKRYNFKKVIIIKKDKEKLEFENYLKNLFNESNINISFFYNDVENLLKEENIENITLNLTLENTLESLKLLNLCYLKNINGIYIDILGKKEYWFKKNIEKDIEEIEELYIEDIFEAGGNDMIAWEDTLVNNDDILYLSKEIYKNLPLWHKYKQKLYDGEIFSHDFNKPNEVYINKEKLLKEEEEILYKILNKLEELKLINIKENKNIKVTFLKDYIKGFIFKSGTWLEILTENIVKSITSIDDIKSGVVFFWNKEEGKIKNEVDVVAVKDSVIVCISCKDSAKYDDSTLNELKIYSEKIGGENSKKILVATKRPIKSSIENRAREMGIDLVILDRDINKFKKNLEEIINKTTQD